MPTKRAPSSIQRGKSKLFVTFRPGKKISDEIYNFTRIRLAPALILIGFAIQVYAILKSTK